MSPRAGLSSQEREIIDHLAAHEQVTVSADQVATLRKVDRRAATQMLVRLRAKGWLRRIKRGVYAPVPLGSTSAEPVVADAWALAMQLFAPCYISGWSAAEHWDLTEQVFNAIAVVTAAPQRHAEQNYAGVKFRVRSVDAGKLFGTATVWVGSHALQVADPSRLLIDVLDTPELGGGARHTIDIVRAYWKSKHADPDQLLGYARQYGRGTVFKRLGFLSEAFGAAGASWLESCRQGISAGISALDPSGPARGRIEKRWSLRINVPVDEP